jgi:hypothetical protein
MIDPNILLQSKPVNIETPLEAQGQVQQVQNLRNLGQIQQGTIAMQPGELTAQSQENQGRAIALHGQQMLNDAMASSVTRDKNGNVVFDKDAIASKLAAGNAGAQIPAVMESLTKIDQANATLQETKARAANYQQELATAQRDYLGTGALAVKDMGYDPHAAVSFVAHALAAKNIDQDTANSVTQKILANPTPQNVQSLVDPLIGQSPKAQEEIRKRAVEANAEARTRVLEDREQDYQDSISGRNQGNWVQSKEPRDGQALYYNTKTGEEKVGGPVDTPEKTRGGLTANAQGVQARANEKEATEAAKTEAAQDAIRDGIGNALRQGDVYYNPKGETLSFDKQIPRLSKDESDDEYKARAAPIIQSLTREMDLRGAAATTQANAATARKNNAILKNGGTPDVSTEQAIAKRGDWGGKAAAPPVEAAPQQAPAQQQVKEGTIIVNPKTKERRKFTQGRWKVISAGA